MYSSIQPFRYLFSCFPFLVACSLMFLMSVYIDEISHSSSFVQVLFPSPNNSASVGSMSMGVKNQN